MLRDLSQKCGDRLHGEVMIFFRKGECGWRIGTVLWGSNICILERRCLESVGYFGLPCMSDPFDKIKYLLIDKGTGLEISDIRFFFLPPSPHPFFFYCLRM